MRGAVVALLAAGIVAGALALARSGRLQSAPPPDARDPYAADLLAGYAEHGELDERALIHAYRAASARAERGFT